MFKFNKCDIKPINKSDIKQVKPEMPKIDIPRMSYSGFNTNPNLVSSSDSTCKFDYNVIMHLDLVRNDNVVYIDSLYFDSRYGCTMMFEDGELPTIMFDVIEKLKERPFDEGLVQYLYDLRNDSDFSRFTESAYYTEIYDKLVSELIRVKTLRILTFDFVYKLKDRIETMFDKYDVISIRVDTHYDLLVYKDRYEFKTGDETIFEVENGMIKSYLLDSIFIEGEFIPDDVRKNAKGIVVNDPTCKYTVDNIIMGVNAVEQVMKLRKEI